MMPATSGTRGEMNRNPGPVPFTRNAPWRGQGKIETVPSGMSYQPRDATFDEAQNGIRALAMEMIRLQKGNEQIRRLGPLISSYMQKVNPLATDAAISGACDHCGVKPDDEYCIAALSHLEKVVFVIIRQLNGRVLYDADLIRAACRDALGLPCPAISQP